MWLDFNQLIALRQLLLLQIAYFMVMDDKKPEKTTESPKDDLDLTYDQARDILEEYLAREQVISYRPADVIEELNRKRSMVIMGHSQLRNKLETALSLLEMEVVVYESFEEALTSDFQALDLVVLDAVQGDLHAVDLLHDLIKDMVLEPTYFVLVGESEAIARTGDWDGLGKGLFLRTSINPDWVPRKIDELMKQALHAPKKAKKDDEPKVAETRPLILVVDDEELLAVRLSKVLWLSGFRADTAGDGKEAIQKVRTINPDLVILDIGLPIKNGLDVLHMLRVFSATKSLPVIILTALRTEQIEDKAKQLGVVAFFEKPLPDDVLLAKIRETLAEKEISDSDLQPE